VQRYEIIFINQEQERKKATFFTSECGKIKKID